MAGDFSFNFLIFSFICQSTILYEISLLPFSFSFHKFTTDPGLWIIVKFYTGKNIKV